MRGKVHIPHDHHHDTGITPACAGKSKVGNLAGNRVQDHPRVCGEKHILLILSTLLLGSPPRVRGKVQLIDAAGQACRITPACAGKSTGGTDA